MGGREGGRGRGEGGKGEWRGEPNEAVRSCLMRHLLCRGVGPIVNLEQAALAADGDAILINIWFDI